MKFIEPTKLSRQSRCLRLGLIGLIIFGLAGWFAYAGGWLSLHPLNSRQITDRFETINGVHSGFRRNHAKGVCVRGWFESNGQGTAISRAAIFRSGQVPIIGRFSLSGGKPYAADAARQVRGLAILFKLVDGEEWRTAMINLPVFPVKTPEAFYEQLQASAPDPVTGKPDPIRMQAFLNKYPESARAMELIRNFPIASGFENSTFNSLNTFRFNNTAGEKVFVRWSLVPISSIDSVDTKAPGQSGTNYLFDALIASLHQHPLQWRLIVTVANPADPTDDATLPWPADRRKIDVGTLIINQVESDDTSPARDLNFDPLILPDGISASDDPLLPARSAVYSQSFNRREGESKQPSAVSAAETQK